MLRASTIVAVALASAQAAWCVPSLVRQVPEGVYMVHDDTGDSHGGGAPHAVSVALTAGRGCGPTNMGPAPGGDCFPRPIEAEVTSGMLTVPLAGSRRRVGSCTPS